jgi:hypothetical protein
MVSSTRRVTGMTIPRHEKDDLEQMIDRHGLAAILEAVSDICSAKADHLRSNWQDAESAKVWDSDAKKISKVVVYSS